MRLFILLLALLMYCSTSSFVAYAEGRADIEQRLSSCAFKGGYMEALNFCAGDNGADGKGSDRMFSLCDDIFICIGEPDPSSLIGALEGKDNRRAGEILVRALYGDYQGAVAAYEALDLSSTGPVHDYVMSLAARSYYRTGETEKARKIYLRLLATRSDYARARTGLSLILADERRYEESALLISSVLSADPSNIDAHCALAYIYDITGRHAEAAAEYERIIELSPHGFTGQCLINGDIPCLGAFGPRLCDYGHDFLFLHDDLICRANPLTPGVRLEEERNHEEDDSDSTANAASTVPYVGSEEAPDVNYTLEGYAPSSMACPVELTKIESLFPDNDFESPASGSVATALRLTGIDDYSGSEEMLHDSKLRKADPAGGEEREPVDSNTPQDEWSGLAGFSFLDIDRSHSPEPLIQRTPDELMEISRLLDSTDSADESSMTDSPHYHWGIQAAVAPDGPGITTAPETQDVNPAIDTASDESESASPREELVQTALLEKQYPSELRARALEREHDTESMTGFDAGYSIISEESGQEETLYEASVYQSLTPRVRVYALFLWQKTTDTEEELLSYFRRAGLRLEYVAGPAITISQQFSINYDYGDDLGSRTEVDLFPDDYWSVYLSYDSFTTDVDLLARVFGIEARRYEAEVSYTPNEKQLGALNLSVQEFSDGNDRYTATAVFEQGWELTKAIKQRLFLETVFSWNTLEDAEYFNPDRDRTIFATLMTEHVLNLLPVKRNVQRLYLGAGKYKQSDFDTKTVATVRYEQELEFSDNQSVVLGAGYSSNAYDGVIESSHTFYVNYNGRF